MATWLLLYRHHRQTCGIDAFRYCYLGFPLKVGLGRTGILLLGAAGLVAIGATTLSVRSGVGDVLDGAVRAAAAIHGVDASLAVLGVDTDEVIVVSAGLSPAEVEQEREIGHWPGEVKELLPRSVDGSRSSDAPIRSRLAVPLEARQSRRGSLVILTRSAESRFGAAELRLLWDLAERTRASLERARRHDAPP